MSHFVMKRFIYIYIFSVNEMCIIPCMKTFSSYQNPCTYMNKLQNSEIVDSFLNYHPLHGMTSINSYYIQHVVEGMTFLVTKILGQWQVLP